MTSYLRQNTKSFDETCQRHRFSLNNDRKDNRTYKLMHQGYVYIL